MLQSIDEYLNHPCRRGEPRSDGHAGALAWRRVLAANEPATAGDKIVQLALAEPEETGMAKTIEAAWQNGHSQGYYEGEKRGFKQGTHWGMFVGACAALIVLSLLAVGGAFAIGAGYIALG